MRVFLRLFVLICAASLSELHNETFSFTLCDTAIISLTQLILLIIYRCIANCIKKELVSDFWYISSQVLCLIKFDIDTSVPEQSSTIVDINLLTEKLMNIELYFYEHLCPSHSPECIQPCPKQYNSID